MFEDECATVSIEKEETLSPPSARCHEDFETKGQILRLRPAYMSIAASILVIAPYSVAMSQSGFGEIIGRDSSSVIMQAVETQALRSISLSEARRMARELQDRIDADYLRLLDADAEVRSCKKITNAK